MIDYIMESKTRTILAILLAMALWATPWNIQAYFDHAQSLDEKVEQNKELVSYYESVR